MKNALRHLMLTLGLLAAYSAFAAPIDTQITFQGSLFDAGVAADGNYDLNFQLWNGSATNTGSKVGGIVSKSNVTVADGVFTVLLDFGAGAFDDQARWVEVLVRDSGGGGSFTPLIPFVPMKPAPQALWAVDAGLLEGKPASDFAATAHSHAVLSTGIGLVSTSYDGSGARTFTVDFGTTVHKVAPGNAPFTLNAGNGLVGGVSSDPIGDGVSTSLAVVPGPGIISSPSGVTVRVDTDTIFLNGSNELQVSAAIAGTGLSNEGLNTVVIGVNNGNGISLAGNKVSASVDAETIGFNNSGELTLLGGSGTGYGNRTVVALSGGDYTNPVAAMTDRASWCGVASIENPCLIKIMPGIYNLPSALTLISYIDIEGSGRNITVLSRSTTGFSGGIITATGHCADETCEVRNLALRGEGSGSGTSVNGIFSGSGAGPRIRNVEIDVSVTGGGNTTGVYVDGASITLIDCDITTSGTTARGISGDDANISVKDCFVEANGTSNTEALYGSGTGGNFETMNSKFIALGAATNSDAVYITNINLTDQGSEFRAGPGSTAARGIFSQRSTGIINLDLAHSKIYASNPSAAANTGILAVAINVVIKDSYLEATGASGTNTGMEAHKSPTVIDNSELIADDKALKTSGSSGGPFAVNISNSNLQSIDGPVVLSGGAQFVVYAYHSRLAGGTVSANKCASIVDETNSFFSSTCP